MARGGYPSLPSGVRARERRAGEAGDTRVPGCGRRPLLRARVVVAFAEGDAAGNHGGQLVCSRGVSIFPHFTIAPRGVYGNKSIGCATCKERLGSSLFLA